MQFSSGVRSINSPNYPSNYAGNKNCYWKISVPTGLIQITFVDFDVQTYDDELKVSAIIFSSIRKKLGTSLSIVDSTMYMLRNIRLLFKNVYLG